MAFSGGVMRMPYNSAAGLVDVPQLAAGLHQQFQSTVATGADYYLAGGGGLNGALLGISGVLGVAGAAESYYGYDILSGSPLTGDERFDRGVLGAGAIGGIVALAPALQAAAGAAFRTISRADWARSGSLGRFVAVASPAYSSELSDFVSRPVSGQTGWLNSRRLTRRELSAFKEEARAIGVGFQKNADSVLLRIDPLARGGFSYATGTVYLRKGATVYEAFHEMTHARQWAEIGKSAYIAQGRYAREQHVLRTIMANENLFSRAEIEHAIWYIKDLRKQYRQGIIQ
jgi:hypothetical protein